MDLLQFFQPAMVVVFLLVAARTSAAMATGPLSTWPGVPLPGRVFLGLAIALVLTPAVASGAPESVALLPTLLVQEFAIGLMLGVASTLLVSALQLAAGLLDFQAGYTFGSSLDPLSGHQSGPLERFLGALAAVLFVELNGHHLFLLSLGDLYAVVPVGATPHLADAADITRFFSAIVAAALAMALPIAVLLLIADVALAVLARAAPQFNLFAVGLPARAGVALIALGLLLPITATQLATLFGQLPAIVPMLTGQ